MFEQTVFTALLRECSKAGKEFFAFDAYAKRHTIDLDWFYLSADAYAPNGIGKDDTPTFVEIKAGNNSKVIEDYVLNAKKKFPRIASKRRIKFLIICEISRDALTLVRKSKIGSILNSDEGIDFEIGWRDNTYELINIYPVEVYSDSEW